MMGRTRDSRTFAEVLKGIDEWRLAVEYLGLKKLPCTIRSPLREDKHPSLSLYVATSGHVRWIDHSTGEYGDLIELFSRLWSIPRRMAAERMEEESGGMGGTVPVSFSTLPRKVVHKAGSTNLKVRTREWNEEDKAYWTSYGVPIPWLDYAEVYPISHKIVEKDGERFIFKADPLAYAFVERRDGKVYVKVYQPLNKDGFKWCGTCGAKVVSLLDKIPRKGELLVVCSSLKDALCLWANTGIPGVALQGEGYNMDRTLVEDLQSRFDRVLICFDNDEAGLRCAFRLAAATGLQSIVLPHFESGKDISDLYKTRGAKAIIDFADKSLRKTY